MDYLLVDYIHDNEIEVGIDEAGRGCFWGPIMAGAVIWERDTTKWTEEQTTIVKQIKDSKKISAKKREYLSEQIKKFAKDYGIGVVSSNEINTYGITWANKEAFSRAIHSLKIYTFDTIKRILLDGELKMDIDMNSQNNIEQYTIPKGDNTYLSIASASILAKVEHDKYVKDYCNIHKELDEKYKLLSNMGYGTKDHRNGLYHYGAHLEEHRSLFIRKWINQDQIQDRTHSGIQSGSQSQSANGGGGGSDCQIVI